MLNPEEVMEELVIPVIAEGGLSKVVNVKLEEFLEPTELIAVIIIV